MTEGKNRKIPSDAQAGMQLNCTPVRSQVTENQHTETRRCTYIRCIRTLYGEKGGLRLIC